MFYDLVTRNPPATPKVLRARRVELMRQIEGLRGRPLVCYVTNSNVNEPRVPAYMHREDLIPLSEVLDSVSGTAVDILIESPGGLAEVAVEIVHLLRPRFDDVAFIVPHAAMSAGTILAMSGDEILMDHRSSLGAIDPQFIGADGRPQPAQAMLAGIETIKQEVVKAGTLNPAYVPILRNVDPGKLQSAHNASELSRQLVTDWLARFKFRKWTSHSSTGAAVTDQDRRQRANEIAHALCDHQRWLSHGRPVKRADLATLRLKITDYGNTPLQAPIWELWVNLSHIMTATNIYKLYESTAIDLAKVAVPQTPVAKPATDDAGKAILDVRCAKCGNVHRLQCDVGRRQDLEPGTERFPRDCMLACRNCGHVMNLTGLKLQVESQLGRSILL